MSKLTALVFRSLVIASLFGGAVACTAEIQVPEGLGSKTSDALGAKKGRDGGSETPVPDAGDGDASVVVVTTDAGPASDSGIDEGSDAGVWGDDDDSSDAGVDDGWDSGASR